MLPWFFLYDRINYMYAHLLADWVENFEMECLSDDHPNIHEELQNGKFDFQRQ